MQLFGLGRMPMRLALGPFSAIGGALFRAPAASTLTFRTRAKWSLIKKAARLQSRPHFRNVCSWHLADMRMAFGNVCFRG
jgi:hypothetical protein